MVNRYLLSIKVPTYVVFLLHFRSQSRMRGDYLFYEEKVETTQEERDAKAARRSDFSASSPS